MSQGTEQTPTPEQLQALAVQNMYSRVMVPAFFNKLAADGLIESPANAKQAELMCQMGDDITRTVHRLYDELVSPKAMFKAAAEAAGLSFDSPAQQPEQPNTAVPGVDEYLVDPAVKAASEVLLTYGGR